jgi:2-phospho-L-lactate guanylyltransferase
MLHAIVPVKNLEHAKVRLSSVLSPSERRMLVLAMLDDVLHALRAAPAVAHVSVISRDSTVLHAAAQHGAEAIVDRMPGLNEALTQAATHVAARGAAALLVLPADLPLVTPSDIDALSGALENEPGAVLAASRDGGTNALLVRPPLVLPFLYGVGSLMKHMEAARQRGLGVEVVRSPGLALDVDQPDDLTLLAKSPGNTAAQQFVRGLYALREKSWCVIGDA